jgi:hypothetical protein
MLPCYRINSAQLALVPRQQQACLGLKRETARGLSYGKDLPDAHLAPRFFSGSGANLQVLGGHEV